MMAHGTPSVSYRKAQMSSCAQSLAEKGLLARSGIRVTRLLNLSGDGDGDGEDAVE